MKYLTVLLTISVIGVSTGGPTARIPPGTRLQIESFGARGLPVVVWSAPAGLWLESARADSVQESVRAITPVTVLVADTVQWLRVVVIGAGAVKLSFDGPTPQARKVPLWGRDVMLRRVNGSFQSTTQIIPLYP